MRLIIAGSRCLTRYKYVRDGIRLSGFRPTCVVSGRAPGIDRVGERWARRNGILVDPCEADWDKYGDLAGKIRNVQMAMTSHALLAIWDGVSPGTRHMIATARSRKLEVYVHLV